jgi:glycosyltransferase involved in cell wall biosynthesis
MTRLVSILIPCYNAGKWIAETIQSALAQTWERKEIIIVDDGSGDGSLDIARRYQSKTLSVLSQENQGAAAARNTALAHAQGDYIQWLDADDLLAPDKIERQLTARGGAGDSRVLLTCAWATFYYRTHRATFKPDSLWRDLEPVEWIITKFRENLYMNPAVWLVSRDLAERAGPWDIRLSLDDDGEYITRVVAASEKVEFVPEAKCYYRKSNPSSLTRDQSTRAYESLFLSLSLSIGRLRALEDSQRTRDACLRLLQDNLRSFYPNHPGIQQKAFALADELGGRLHLPALDWKYHAAKTLLGRDAANKVKNLKVRLKASALRNWDKWLYEIGK